MSPETKTSFFSRLSRMQRLYSKALHNRLATYDVKPGYLDILSALWDKEGVTQKQLNSTLDVEQATLSNTLTRMERDGLVIKKANIKDRRHKHIHLTDKGRSLKSAVVTAVEDVQTIVHKGLTVNDRRYFNRILRQMADQLEDDLIEPLLVLLDEVTDEQP